MSIIKLPDGRKVRVYRVEYNVVAYVANPVTEDEAGEFDVTGGGVPDLSDAIELDHEVHRRWDYCELDDEGDLDDMVSIWEHGNIRLFIDGEATETLVSELLEVPEKDEPK